MKKFRLPLIGIVEVDQRLDPQGKGGYRQYYVTGRTSLIADRRNPNIYLCILRQDGDSAIMYDLHESFDEHLFNLTSYETV